MTQSIKQKQYYNKFNKDFKNVYTKKKKRERERERVLQMVLTYHGSTCDLWLYNSTKAIYIQ